MGNLSLGPKNGIFSLYISRSEEESLSLSLSVPLCQRAGWRGARPAAAASAAARRSTSTMHLGTFHWGHRPHSLSQLLSLFASREGDGGALKRKKKEQTN